ncbi:hypothetical protein H4219_001123 [Mycoemilia scoparia]|uniref:Uncharacterized protein n=1 Tax=Mycoemilia scoparia TaxID=417184 RepID=A0A9W8DVS7_9FUNG|nr:hypothetical protein H4219_001123 [Mycoemilia scoparia]
MTESASLESNTNHIGTKENSSSLYTRIRMTPTERFLVVTLNGAFWGVVVGAYLGGRQAGFQYLAERAHRLPTTVQSWYYYHKWKNYKVALGAFKRGSIYALRVAGVCAVYEGIETTVDHVQEEVNAASSIAAGVGTAAIVGILARLPRSSFMRSMKFGAIGGGTIGLLQDIANWHHGKPPTYFTKLTSRS